MSTFDVRTDTLLAAANELEKAIETFTSAAAQAATASETLCNDWEGDAKIKFQEEQVRVNKWYDEMAQAAWKAWAYIKEIAKNYEEADTGSAAAI